MVFNSKKNYMFRPIAAIFRLLQFCSKAIICLYFEGMLRSHHRYALQSVYLVGSLMVNDCRMYVLWVGIRREGLYGGRDNRLCCLWYTYP